MVDASTNGPTMHAGHPTLPAPQLQGRTGPSSRRAGTPTRDDRLPAHAHARVGTPTPAEVFVWLGPGRGVDTGSEARCFAQYMRIHALRFIASLPLASDNAVASSAPRGAAQPGVSVLPPMRVTTRGTILVR